MGFLLVKSNMLELFLCEAREQMRSIVSLCEHFCYPLTRAKRVKQNDFTATPFRNRSQSVRAVYLAFRVGSRV